MAYLTIKNVVIRGFSACVPKTIEENINSPIFKTTEEAAKFISSTGVERRRIASNDITTSDLCITAANRLIENLHWNKSEIDCIIFVTQTPDYILPATSCIIQNKLQLSKECYALDISLGCSGWVYGLSVIANLLSTGMMKKGLLLVGDTALKSTSPMDKSAWPLFGDAGTATAIEFEDNQKEINFHFACDGSGFDAIIIPEGGFRKMFSKNSLEYEQFEEGISRNKLQTILNGMDVFSFGISKAPESINKMTDKFQIDLEKIDLFTFHQANLFMNEKICKKLKLPSEKVLYSLKDFGNTSSATIPLTLITQAKKELETKHLKHIACGFGVGLSWGSVYFETDKIVVPELLEI
jgi:3-oxoacyl-[acyl-carrier-protein] synthase-3